MNLNHFCDPDPKRNWFHSVIDPAGRRYDNMEPHHHTCKGEELYAKVIKNGKVLEWAFRPCECECHWKDRISTPIGSEVSG